MKKRVLSLFMTLMLCLMSLPTTALAAELAAADSTPAVETVDGEGTSGETDTAGGAEVRGDRSCDRCRERSGNCGQVRRERHRE